MPKISVVITSFNSARTLGKTLASVTFADDVVVLDSGSQDETPDIVADAGARFFQQPFKGFAQQKSDAIALAQHDWVLLLDSDEWLSDEAIEWVKQWQNSEPKAKGYRLPRIEWVFWRWAHPWVRRGRFLRLFDRRVTRMKQVHVHESPQVSGPVADIPAPIYHFGETSIAVKVEKINQYSSLSALDKQAREKRARLWHLTVYPVAVFLIQLFVRRQLFSGTAGWINAAIISHYAFLKYAKLRELQQRQNASEDNEQPRAD